MGKQEKIVITNDNNRLTPEDIERMLKEAEMWADQDKEQKEKIDAKNSLEQYGYSLKRQVEDSEQLGGKLSEEDKEKILSVVKEKLEWLSADEFNSAKKDIEEIVQPIVASLYQHSNSQGHG